MSVNSTVGIKTETGFMGRYVRWDGYPTWMGLELARMVRKWGSGKTIKKITDQISWSSINTAQKGGIKGLHETYQGDRRFSAQAGVGVCHTYYDYRRQMPGANKAYFLDREWNIWDGTTFTEACGGSEWAYGITETGEIEVWVITFPDGWSKLTPVFVGTIPTGLTDNELEEVTKDLLDEGYAICEEEN